MADFRELWTCDKCTSQFHNRGLYNRHLKTHTKPFKCDLCSRGFALRAVQRRHTQLQHRVGNKKHTCQCGKDFSRKDTLQRHMRRYHPKKEDDVASDVQIIDPQTVESLDIWHAATMAKIELVRQFCANGGDISSRAADGSTMLHCAARAGNLDVIQYLLAQGADNWIKNKRNRTALCEAVIGGSLEAVRMLVPPEESLNESSTHNRSFFRNTFYDVARDGGSYEMIECLKTATHLMCEASDGVDLKHIAPDLLHYAAAYGNETLLRFLVEEERFDINSRLSRVNNIGGRRRDTPLYLASLFGNVGVVAILLLYDQIKVNPSGRGESGLGAASRKGHVEVVKRLSQHKDIDINHGCRTQRTPLHAALKHGHVEISEILLDHEDTNLDPTTYRPRLSLLHSAAISGYIQSVQLVLRKIDIDVNHTDDQSDTPLHLALERCHLNLSDWLLDHKDINLGMRNKEGRSVLHSAAISGKVEAVQLVLNKTDISINDQDNGGDTPLILALERSHFELSEMLFDHKDIDTSIKDSHGRSLLHVAAILGKSELVRLVLDKADLDVNATTNKGETALATATYHKRFDVIDILLQQKGIQADCRTRSGDTPLHIAAKKGKIETIKLLLSRENVDINSRVEKNLWYDWRCGKTALDLAREEKHQEIVDLLIEHGATGKNPDQADHAGNVGQEMDLNMAGIDQICWDGEVEMDTEMDQNDSSSDEDMRLDNTD